MSAYNLSPSSDDFQYTFRQYMHPYQTMQKTHKRHASGNIRIIFGGSGKKAAGRTSSPVYSLCDIVLLLFSFATKNASFCKNCFTQKDAIKIPCPCLLIAHFNCVSEGRQYMFAVIYGFCVMVEDERYPAAFALAFYCFDS